MTGGEITGPRLKVTPKSSDLNLLFDLQAIVDSVNARFESQLPFHFAGRFRGRNTPSEDCGAILEFDPDVVAQRRHVGDPFESSGESLSDLLGGDAVDLYLIDESIANIAANAGVRACSKASHATESGVSSHRSASRA